MRELTPRQKQILEMIQEFIADTGMPPTRAEIARQLGFKSANAAEEHLRALQRKGVLELLPGASRGIQLKDSLREQMGLPLVGRVAAGSPILAQENVLRTPAVDPLLFKPRADYLLEVRGMSMRDAGILDGDWLAVHRQAQAENGQVVVARLDDEVTVKRLKLRGARAELLAENPDYSPIVLDLRREPLVIEGIAVGIIRPSL